jgi:hypothetical protein
LRESPVNPGCPDHACKGPVSLSSK